jgi:hypothetical protein
MKYLFSHLNPDTYGKGFFSDQDIQDKIRKDIHNQETDIRNRIMAEKNAALRGTEGDKINFSQKYTIEDDLYTNAVGEISVGQDMVKFTNVE